MYGFMIALIVATLLSALTKKTAEGLAGIGSRPWTAAEIRDRFMRHLLVMANYWATVESVHGPKTPGDRCRGLAFSILSTIDGCSIELPGFDLVCRPHPDDREYHQRRGENWYPAGLAFNASDWMHELWHSLEERP